MVAGRYLSAVDRFGSPAAPAASIPGRDEPIRRASDAVLQHALRLTFEKVPAPRDFGSAPVVTSGDSEVSRRGRCLDVSAGASGSVELQLSTPGVVLRSAGPDATVRLRRFASDYGPDDEAAGAAAFHDAAVTAFGVSLKRPYLLRLPADDWVALRIPEDQVEPPWFMRVAGAESITACGLPDGFGRERDRHLAAFRTSEARLDPAAAALVLPGLRIPIVPDAVPGAVDEVLAYGQVLIVKGWAAASGHRRPTDWVFVFSRDGKLLRSGPPALERPDLAARYGEWTRRAGFQMNSNPPRAGELAQFQALTVVAVDGGRASVLPLPAAGR